jgi:hypothetical protein
MRVGPALSCLAAKRGQTLPRQARECLTYQVCSRRDSPNAKHEVSGPEARKVDALLARSNGLRVVSQDKNRDCRELPPIERLAASSEFTSKKPRRFY